MRLAVSLTLACVVAVLPATAQAAEQAPLGTAFSYQGRLEEDGAPVSDGDYDFYFKLWDVGDGGTMPLASTSTVTAPVTDGPFTELVDFGSRHFDGEARRLDTYMKPPGAPSFINLPPRQELTPEPRQPDERE